MVWGLGRGVDRDIRFPFLLFVFFFLGCKERVKNEKGGVGVVVLDWTGLDGWLAGKERKGKLVDKG